MPVRAIRAANYPTAARHTISGRLSARLSDGTFVMIAFDVAGSTPQIYLYSAPNDNSAWTLRCTVNANNGTAGVPGAWTFGAIAIDDSDNVHLVGSTWSTLNLTKPGISYWKLSNDGSLGFTASAPVVIQGPNVFSANSVGVDIDFVGSGANGRAILGVSGVSLTPGAYCRYYLINGSTAVFLSLAGTSPQLGSTNVTKYQPIRSASISGRHNNESDNTLVFMYTYLTGNGAYNYALGRVTNAGASPISYGIGLFGDLGATRVHMSWAGDMQVIVSVPTSGGRVVVERFQWTASYVLTRDVYVFATLPGATIINGYNFVPFVISASRVAYFMPNSTSTAILVVYVDIFAPSTAVVSAALMWDNLANLSAAAKPIVISSVSGNFNRGFERNQLNPSPIVDYVQKNLSKRTTYGNVPQRAPILPAALVPAPGATVDTDIPALSANLGTDSYGVQSDYVVTWEFATDVDFTAPITSSFGLVNGGGQAKKILEVVNKLTAQGTWYFRANTTDRYGFTSAWTATQTFTNTHLPVPVPVMPTNDQILSWNGGNAGLDWDFSDSSPTASQSAYEVIVQSVADGSTVLDTGEVLSSATQAVVTIPSAYKDLELLWTVVLWDDQGVVGPTSQPNSFYASDSPIPVISNPPSIGAIITSGILTVAWDPGIPGVNKSQARFRVVVQEGTQVVHDSNTINSSNAAYTIPVGIIHDGHAYNISLTVWDTINLAGRANVSFGASFVTPAPANDLEVFSYNFESRGYVWCGWTNVSIDPDFVYWNLYRRAQGESEWTLLHTAYQNQAFYGYPDYTAAANVQYEYAVTQVINSSGSGDLIESNFGVVITTTFGSSHYWLIDPLKSTPPVPIYQVTADSYTDEYERNTFTVIGRGRKSDVGEHLGVNGSITTAARDHSNGQAFAISNGFADPCFQDNIPFSYEWAIAFSAGGSTGIAFPYECAPSCHEQVMRIDASANSTVTLTQTLPKKVVAGPGDHFTLSAHFDDLLNAFGFTVKFLVTWLDSTGATITTQTLTAISLENVKGNDNWFRYGVEGICNVPAASAGNLYAMKVQLQVADTSGNGLSFLLDGAMANYGPLAPYGDADSLGWAWDGAPNVSGSYTSAYYTARRQRQDIVALSGQDAPNLLLRTPFGDVFPVSVQDIGFSRLGGVGSQAEYGDITIPYMEVAN